MTARDLLIILSLASGLSACGTAPDPVVDRRGVSDARYNQDLAACKQAPGGLSLSNPVATCMTNKGYNVLMGKSLL